MATPLHDRVMQMVKARKNWSRDVPEPKHSKAYLKEVLRQAAANTAKKENKK